MSMENKVKKPSSCSRATTLIIVLSTFSLVLAVELVCTSTWVLLDTFSYRESNATTVDDGVDGLLKILIGCSAATGTVGGLQVLTSVFLCICSSGKKGASWTIYRCVNTMGFVPIVGAVVSFYYWKVSAVKEEGIFDEWGDYWVGTMIADGIFLLLYVFAAFFA